MVDQRGGGDARVMTGSVKQLVLIWAMVFGLFAVVNVMSAEEPEPQPTFAEFFVALERGDVREVVMRTRDNSVLVERARGETYTVGYPNEYAPALVEQLRATETSFDIEPGGSGLGGMLLRVLLPVAVLVGFGLLVLRRSRGGAAGTVPSDAHRRGSPRRMGRRPASPTSPAPTRRWRSCERSPTSSRAPRGSRPLVRESRRACSCTGLRAPARRCWPVRSRVRRACRSSRSRARTSSRCSSASAPRACATCSSRPRPRRPRSSSSTRSTRWVATAAPVWVAATTSASRRSTSYSWRWMASSRPIT